MPDTIALFWVNNTDRTLDALIADLYGPSAALGSEAGSFTEAASGKQPAAVLWNDAFWVFDRKRILDWAVAFQEIIVLTALQTYTGAAPFGEHRSFFQDVPVRPILLSDT